MLSIAEKFERLNSIGFILERSGSDNAVVTLRKSDCDLLNLTPGNADDIDDHVEILRHWIETTDGNPVNRSSKRSILKVEAEVLGDGSCRSCNVHVGTARAALKEALGGRALEGRRQPDIQAPSDQRLEPAGVS
jgi:hypothetical protein